MRHTTRRPLAALILVAVAALAAAAVGFANASGGSDPDLGSTPPAAKPSTRAEQRALHARFTAARRAKHRRARTATTTLAADFAIFRRASTANDQAPGQRPGDDSRKAFTFPATSSRPAYDVFLIAREDQICVVGGGGSACGPAGQATTRPVVLAMERTDGTTTVLYGPADDTVTEVEITGQGGHEATVQPTDNAFALEFPDSVVSVRMRHRDGRVVDVVP